MPYNDLTGIEEFVAMNDVEKEVKKYVEPDLIETNLK